jgi:hypothetical protein
MLRINKPIHLEEPQEPKQKINLMLCLPGDATKSRWGLNLVQIVLYFLTRGITVGLRNMTLPNIYGVRNACIGTAGDYRVHQLPFGGEIDYDFMVWWDADQYPEPQQIERLMGHNEDIVCGWSFKSPVAPGEDAGAKSVNCGFYHDPKYQVLTRDEMMAPELRDEKGLVEVDWAGFALWVNKKGVFESLRFPWFRSWVKEWTDNGVEMADVVSDDGGICELIKSKGFKIKVDPTVKVGHWKGSMA